MKLNNVRVAFPELFTAKPFGTDPNSAPAYSATLIIDGNDKDTIAAIKAAIVEVAKQKWADKAPAVLKSLSEGGKVAAYSGDRKAEYSGFEGNFVVACRSKTRPLVIDQRRAPIQEGDGKIYPGCYVNAVIEFWAQDNAYGKRINCEIKGVQFSRDGDSFGGGGAPAKADDFEALDGDDAGGFDSLADDFGL